MKNKTLLLILLLISALKLIKAQSLNNDPNWTSFFLEDFNSTPAWPKWKIYNLDPEANGTFIFLDQPDNVFVSGGNLNLCAKKGNYTYNSVTYPYTSGQISTWQTFKYGYFEARAYCQSGKGYFPAFWLQIGATGSCDYTEIDIFENDGGKQFYWSNTVHYQTVLDCTYSPKRRHVDQQLPDPLSTFPLISDTWHIWAVEWNPSFLIFYLDGVELRRVSNEINQAMPIILDQALYSLTDAIRKPDNTTPQNGYLIVDYVSVHKSINQCTQDATILDFSTYTYGIKNSITVGNGSTPVSVAANSSVVLRASQGINITNNFTVPLGSEFSAINTSCY